jgi:hypothetical protein
MKPLVLILAVFLFALLPRSQASAQSCLQLDTIHFNVDSAYYDACAPTTAHQKIYCRRHYTLRFDWYVISTPTYGYDTAIVYQWTDIDSRFASIRAAFQGLENTAGHFTLTKRLASISDTGNRLSHSFILRFDSLLDVDTALALLKSIPNMTAIFNGRPGLFLSTIPSDTCLIPGLAFSQIALDGTTNPFSRYLHPLGWQWQIYKLHCPMAWEMTMGRSAPGSSHPYIHVIGSDQFGTDEGSDTNIVYPDPSTNPDLVPNFVTVTQSGINNEQPNGTQNSGDGGASDLLRDGHGHQCISQAIAIARDGPMIGTCPECTGMALDWKLATVMPDEIDVDGIKGNGITVPEIEWSSASGPASPQSSDFIRMMGKGMAIFAAGGNGPGYSEPDPSNPSENLAFPQAQNWPGYTAYLSGGSNPFNDVHPLAVEGTMDGVQYGPANGSACVGNVGGEFIRCFGPERFDRDYDFSGGLDKFDASPNVNNRLTNKTYAFVDVVAPSELVLSAVTTEYGGSAGYGIGNGTSFSAPEVAGIAGLMRSINYYVSPNDSTPADLADVQRNINNIITFTSDKIADYNDFIPLPENDTEATRFPESVTDEAYTSGALDPQAAGTGSWQYNYVNQSNDPLSRSWAQRVGFGRANAYRAVANAIYCNGIHLYNRSRDLSPDFAAGNCMNENSKYLMHFGAWQAPDGAQMDTSLVLQSGGKIIPNQTPPWPHLNQGETLLNSFDGKTATVLTVGTNDILAIDGIVKGDGKANHQITAAGTTGKILITGYLQDVEITGDTTKVDDLIIYSSGNNAYGNVTVSTGQRSEIYGVVQLQDNGNFIVNGGNVTIQPGGEIAMEGNNNFEIQSGLVKMMASSTISSTTQQVIVDNGATLEIAGLLAANILCEVHVKQGGMLLVDGGADLQVDQFLVDSGGTLKCAPGGRLTLNDNTLDQCNGNWIFSGTSNAPCLLTGGVSICGSVEQVAGVEIAGSGKTFEMLNYSDTGIAIIVDTNGVPSNVQEQPLLNTASIQVTVYPNPASGTVKIFVENLPEPSPAIVDVVNEMGNSVATIFDATVESELGLTFSLDCSKLPSGSYYADLQTEATHHTVKFTVEH